MEEPKKEEPKEDREVPVENPPAGTETMSSRIVTIGAEPNQKEIDEANRRFLMGD